MRQPLYTRSVVLVPQAPRPPCDELQDLLEALDALTADNDQSEYYLTDTLGWLVGRNEVVRSVATDDTDEVVGINTVDELAAAEQLYLARRRED